MLQYTILDGMHDFGFRFLRVFNGRIACSSNLFLLRHGALTVDAPEYMEQCETVARRSDRCAPQHIIYYVTLPRCGV